MNSVGIIKMVVGDDEPLISSLQCLWERGEAKLKQLYGDECQSVIDKCYQVSPFFCFQVVTNVYAIWWQLSILTDYEKSLVTCVALLVTKQFNQFSVLVNTFYVSGGDESKLQNIIRHMLDNDYIDTQTANRVGISLIDKEDLSKNEKILVDVAALVSIQGEVASVFKDIDDANIEKIIVAINHLITYIGCPKVWDGTAQLKQALF